MAIPSMAATGRYQGPFAFIHLKSTSSFAFGNVTGDVQVGNSSLAPVSGIIHSIVTTVPTVSATAAAYTLTVDGNTSSAITIGSSTFGTVPLDIGFNGNFIISCSSGSTEGLLVYAALNF